MIVKLLQDNAINAVYQDERGPEVINSTHADKAQSPLVQALATALPFKGAMTFVKGAPEPSFNTRDCVVRVDGRVLTPESGLSTETPEVQAFVSTIYEHDGGHYANEWALRQAADEPQSPEPLTPAQAKAAKRRIIEQEHEAAFESGMPYALDGWQDVVQIRPQDQMNLIIMRDNAKDAIAAGITGPVLEFRGQKNLSRWITPQQMLELTDAARTRGYEIYRATWARKDTLDAIDLEAPDAMEQINAV